MTQRQRRAFTPLRRSSLRVARAWAIKELATRLWDYRFEFGRRKGGRARLFASAAALATKSSETLPSGSVRDHRVERLAGVPRADRRSRVAEDDEAVRPDGERGLARRDRAHRDPKATEWGRSTRDDDGKRRALRHQAC